MTSTLMVLGILWAQLFGHSAAAAEISGSNGGDCRCDNVIALYASRLSALEDAQAAAQAHWPTAFEAAVESLHGENARLRAAASEMATRLAVLEETVSRGTATPTATTAVATTPHRSISSQLTHTNGNYESEQRAFADPPRSLSGDGEELYLRTSIKKKVVQTALVDTLILNVTTIYLQGSMWFNGQPVDLTFTAKPTTAPTQSPVPNPTPRPTPEPTTTTYAREFYRTGCQTWGAARATCQAGGGDLVVILNASKNDEVVEYMQSFSDYSSCQGPYPWMGASGCSGSSCNWVDGSPWSYTGPGFAVDDPCLHFYTSGTWGTWCTTCQVINEIEQGACNSQLCLGFDIHHEQLLLKAVLYAHLLMHSARVPSGH